MQNWSGGAARRLPTDCEKQAREASWLAGFRSLSVRPSVRVCVTGTPILHQLSYFTHTFCSAGAPVCGYLRTLAGDEHSIVVSLRPSAPAQLTVFLNDARRQGKLAL